MYDPPNMFILPFLKFEILFPIAAKCEYSNSLPFFVNFKSESKFSFSITNFLRGLFL